MNIIVGLKRKMEIATGGGQTVQAQGDNQFFGAGGHPVGKREASTLSRYLRIIAWSYPISSGLPSTTPASSDRTRRHECGLDILPNSSGARYVPLARLGNDGQLARVWFDIWGNRCGFPAAHAPKIMVGGFPVRFANLTFGQRGAYTVWKGKEFSGQVWRDGVANWIALCVVAGIHRE